MRTSSIAKLALLFCGIGVLLHFYTAAFKTEGGLTSFLVALVLWSCLPYAVSAALAMLQRTQVFGLGGAAACLAADVFMHYSVFIAPKGSTAAMGLLFMPLWNLLALGPAGAAIAWCFFKLSARRSNAP
jgi:hypothetical protein